MFISCLLPLQPRSQEIVSPLEGDIVSTQPACLGLTDRSKGCGFIDSGTGAHRQKQGMCIHRFRGRGSQTEARDVNL